MTSYVYLTLSDDFLHVTHQVLVIQFTKALIVTFSYRHLRNETHHH